MSTSKKCQVCGKGLVYSGRGRPPTAFCSRKCKDVEGGRRKRERLMEERGRERRCPVCDSVIPESVTLRAICCSRECGVTYQNQKKAEKKRQQVLESRKPCPECGGDLSEHLSARWKFCSTECKRKAHSARWRAKSRGYMREYLYGLSEEQYDAMMKEQGGVCAICGTDDWGGKHGVPHVDHCHNSKSVRKLLCASCNYGLGCFKDDPDRLRAAAEYIEAHQ